MRFLSFRKLDIFTTVSDKLEHANGTGRQTAKLNIFGLSDETMSLPVGQAPNVISLNGIEKLMLSI